jgi:hypothetical protein
MRGLSGGSDIVFMIAAIIFVIALIWLYFVGLPKLRRFLRQQVFDRRAHREGQQLVSQKLWFTARASIEQVRNAALSTVKVAPTVPTIIMDAYVKEATDNYILYCYGNRINPDFFRAVLQFHPVDGGVSGSWDIVNWTLGDGVVEGQSVMKRLIADINTALAKVDPSTRLHPSSLHGVQPGTPQAPGRVATPSGASGARNK